MIINWAILNITAVDGLITDATYKVTAKNNDVEVTTEGNWYFKEAILKIPFTDVTEQMVIDWIKSATTIDDKNIIENNLREQIKKLENQTPSVLPWGPKVFTLNMEE